MAEWNEFLHFSFGSASSTEIEECISFQNGGNQASYNGYYFFDNLEEAKTKPFNQWTETTQNNLRVKYSEQYELYVVTNSIYQLNAVSSVSLSNCCFVNEQGEEMPNSPDGTRRIFPASLSTIQSCGSRILQNDIWTNQLSIWKIKLTPNISSTSFPVDQLKNYPYISLTVGSQLILTSTEITTSGWSSDTLNSNTKMFYRVSDGSRYSENILPSMAETVVDIPGRQGQMFASARFKSRQITIKFAFTGITEDDIERMRYAFDGLAIQSLTLDTMSGTKTYKAKVTGTPRLQVIPMDNNGSRTYNGEGTIQFTCPREDTNG